jgi:hypothetical protein
MAAVTGGRKLSKLRAAIRCLCNLTRPATLTPNRHPPSMSPLQGKAGQEVQIYTAKQKICLNDETLRAAIKHVVVLAQRAGMKVESAADFQHHYCLWLAVYFAFEHLGVYADHRAVSSRYRARKQPLAAAKRRKFASTTRPFAPPSST